MGQEQGVLIWWVVLLLTMFTLPESETWQCYLVLKTHLWLPRTFRIESSSLPLGCRLSLHCPLVSHHSLVQVFISVIPNIEVHSSHTSPRLCFCFPTLLILFLPPGVWFTLLFSWPIPFSTFRTLKRHLFQKNLPWIPKLVAKCSSSFLLSELFR